jgi:hypothetical protein
MKYKDVAHQGAERLKSMKIFPYVHECINIQLQNRANCFLIIAWEGNALYTKLLRLVNVLLKKENNCQRMYSFRKLFLVTSVLSSNFLYWGRQTGMLIHGHYLHRSPTTKTFKMFPHSVRVPCATAIIAAQDLMSPARLVAMRLLICK